MNENASGKAAAIAVYNSPNQAPNDLLIHEALGALRAEAGLLAQSPREKPTAKYATEDITLQAWESDDLISEIARVGYLRMEAA